MLVAWGRPSPAAQPGQPVDLSSTLANAGSRPAAPRAGWRSASAKARMEGAHQHVHPDHSILAQRILRGRAEHILRATAKNAREQRHDCEGRRGRNTQSAAPRTTAAGHSSRVPIVCVVMAFHPSTSARTRSSRTSCREFDHDIRVPGGTRIIELPVVLDSEVRIRTCGSAGEQESDHWLS